MFRAEEMHVGFVLRNGGVVLKYDQIDRDPDAYLVLAWLKHNQGTPFVTWRYEWDGDETFHGCYFWSLDEAMKSYDVRLGKYAYTSLTNYYLPMEGIR